MYYKSLLEEFKVNHKNRLLILDEIYSNSQLLVIAKLIPRDINICPCCKSTETIKDGLKHRLLKDDYLANKPTLINLEYNRFKCKNCSKLWNDTITGLTSKSDITLNMKLNIIEDLSDDLTFTQISRKRGTSIQEVINIFEEYINFDRTPFGDVLCLDEFKNLRHSKGKYAFVMYDPNAHKINDILPDRIQNTIDTYLYKIDYHEKDKVKYVITDMNESYRTIIKRHFPNSTHIIDCFHYMRYVEDAFNDVRIRIQNKFKDTTPQYKILKSNWKMLSAYKLELDNANFYNPIRKTKTSMDVIIDDACAIDDDMTEAYLLTQHFLKGIREVKYEDSDKWMSDWIHLLRDSQLHEFQELRFMFINWRKEILNSFIRFGDKRLHNGYLEGMNTKIKTIKRISYGYTNFHHFRNRILLIVNKEHVIKSVNKSLISRKQRKKKQ